MRLQKYFLVIIKNEVIYLEDFTDRDHARSVIYNYIEVFYNQQRIHQTLGYKTPNEYGMMNVA